MASPTTNSDSKNRETIEERHTGREADRQRDRQAGIEDRLPDSLHLEDTLVERGELKLIPHLRLVS